MNKRWISIAIVALLAATVATAQPGPAGPKALASYLQLSDQQIASWQQIAKDTAATVKPLAENARDLQQQLRSALQAATPDPTAVGKLAVQLESVRAQIKAAHDAADAKRLAVLNADQKTKYQAFQAAMAFLRQQGPRRGQGGAGPAPFPGE
jgi:Spy/CpxP family protein refolding chaperone